MSAYRGRTGPNFSEYLNNLNTISPPYEQDQFNTDDLNLDADLAMFTNADFTHFDVPMLSDAGPVGFDLDGGGDANDNLKYEDLLLSELTNSPIEMTSSNPTSHFSSYNTPIQPAPPSNNVSSHVTLPTQMLPPIPNSTSNSSSRESPLKRKAESNSPTSILSPEGEGRLAAEEDKRRRNTAASARFRVKKKQREQALEQTVKDVNDRNAILEAKVHQLEIENKWLKNLITEKHGNQSKEEIAEAYQQFRRESEEREENETRGTEHKQSVSTQS